MYLNKYKKQNHAEATIVKRLLWIVISSIVVRNSLSLFSSFKILCLKSFGAKIGKGVIIKQGVNIKYPWKLSIGDHCWIGENVWIDNLDIVTIEENVCISQGAYLLTGNHDYKSRSFDLIMEPIYIQSSVWIGAKAIVCPGVTCKKLSVLTVQSVATKDLEESWIYQGNPAIKLRKRNTNEESF